MIVRPSSTAEPIEDVDSSQLEEEEMDVDIEFEGYLLADNDEEELMEVHCACTVNKCISLIAYMICENLEIILNGL
jgi:hypothetical protein